MKVKHSILALLAINLLIRIPRMLYAHGSDGFLAMWEAQLILNGSYFSNGFNFLTLLGLVPFSGYPIGFLFTLCFFLIISARRIMIATLLFDLVFTTVFVITTYYLSSELEIKDSSKIYFSLILTTLPNIFSFSYYQTSSRYPIFALIPLVFFLLLRFIKKKKTAPLFIALFLSILLNLIHRMAIVLVGIVFLAIIYFFIEKFSKKDILSNLHNNKIELNIENIGNTSKINRKKKFNNFLNYLKKRIWIFSIIVFFFVGFAIFGTNLYNVYYRSKFNIYCYVIAIIDCDYVYMFVQPIVDQWFHYGIPFLLFLATIIMMILPKFNSILEKINYNKSILYLIFLVLPFVLVYQLIYSYYFLCYIIAIVSMIAIQTFETNKFRHYLWPITGLIVGGFIIIYHFFTETKVLPYFIISLFITGVSIIAIILLTVQKTKERITYKFGNFYNKNKLFVIFFFSILIFNSMFIVDRSNLFTKRNQSIYEHITVEERDIANFLIQNGYGTFESFDYTFSTHIAVLTGWLFIQDQHNIGVFLLEDRTVNNISCSFSLISNWPNMDFFNCNHTNGRNVLYTKLYNSECYSLQALVILKEYNIKYFISSIHSNNSYTWEYTTNSKFIESLYGYVPIALVTENYYVWNTTTLFS